MSSSAMIAALMVVLLPLAVSEAKDWLPRLAVTLVRWAARRLGDPWACARYEEEWAANVEAVPGKLSPLVSAFGYLVVVPRMRSAVRRGPSLLRTRPTRLPASTDHFIGRREELAALDDGFVTHGRKRTRRRFQSVVVVTGMAGAGKTSLALHWAHQNKQRFPDGVLYIDLHGYDPGRRREIREVLPRFLRDLGVRAADIPGGVDEQVELYRRVVARRRLLILLDNVGTVGQVQPLLPNTSACLVLVTSRVRLSGLGACDNARQVALGVLAADEAVELLEAVAGVDRIDAQREVAQELAALCGFLPLALRIAAEQLTSRPHISIRDLVHDLRNESTSTEALPPENAIRTIFSWSYRTLPKMVAWTFRHLALFPGNSITQQEVAALLGGKSPVAHQILEALCDAHLLERAIETGVYLAHPLLQAYARERLEAEEPDQIRSIQDTIPRRISISAAPCSEPGPWSRRLGLRRPPHRECPP